MSELFEKAPEIEALRMGMGWGREDFNKPHVIIESTYGAIESAQKQIAPKEKSM